MRQDRELAQHQRIVADKTAAQSLRRTLETFTPELGSDVVQTLQHLATELVGDAVTPAGPGIVELDLFVSPGRVRLTVTDAGPGFGPNLTAIDSMTDRWGRSDDRGGRVWVEIDRVRHATQCADRTIRSRTRTPRGRPRRGGRS